MGDYEYDKQEGHFCSGFVAFVIFMDFVAFVIFMGFVAFVIFMVFDFMDSILTSGPTTTYLSTNHTVAPEDVHPVAR